MRLGPSRPQHVHQHITGTLTVTVSLYKCRGVGLSLVWVCRWGGFVWGGFFVRRVCLGLVCGFEWPYEVLKKLEGSKKPTLVTKSSLFCLTFITKT